VSSLAMPIEAVQQEEEKDPLSFFPVSLKTA
jgi:hypothetical protein